MVVYAISLIHNDLQAQIFAEKLQIWFIVYISFDVICYIKQYFKLTSYKKPGYHSS